MIDSRSLLATQTSIRGDGGMQLIWPSFLQLWKGNGPADEWASNISDKDWSRDSHTYNLRSSLWMYILL